MVRGLLTGWFILIALTLMAIAPIQGRSQAEDTIPLELGVAQNGSIQASTGRDCVLGHSSSQTANYRLIYAAIVFDQPPAPVVTGCLLKRTESGAFALVIKGASIQSGAAVEIGGITPKSVKYKRPEFPDGSTFTKVVATGRVCRALPGIIIITNPGPFGVSGFPFFCFEKCPD